MPEGPELKHSRDELRKIVLGRKIHHITSTPDGRYSTTMPTGYSELCKELPLTVESIDTKGKFMWWTMSGLAGEWYMWCTYGMSGQWSPRYKKHTSVIVDHDSGKLYFVDPRRFGTIKFTKDKAELDKKLATLGPDVLEDPPLPPELFTEKLLCKPNRTIVEALMDQSCISGVGNYVKAECLYRAGLSPHRLVSSLVSGDFLKLWSEVVLVVRESYADQGASIRTYRSVDDSVGAAQFNFKIYNMKNCPLGHKTLREETADGRTSWWCDKCQK